MTDSGTPASLASRLLPACLIALCTLIAPSPAMADIYKWTGADGKINYTQMPPPAGIPSEQIKQAYTQPATPPATPNPAVEQQKRVEQEKQVDDADAAMAELEKENAEIRRLNCDAASRNLAALENESQRNFINEKGEYLRPTDEQRKKLIEDTRQQVEKYCTE